jgi:MoaA/NifB/PqqE/SkfB family radical SAM enzyme
MNLPQYNTLHIETTTRCILACSACPRTTWHEIIKKPVAKHDIDVDLLEKFLDCDGGRKFNQFLLCGDYGDAIYYPNLIDLIKRFRNQVCYNIITNGSRQTEKFWTNLSKVLTEEDTVIFSIDGLESTNHLYRINSDWNSVMQGMDIMLKSPAQVHWKTIVFQFNYDQLKEIKSFAEAKGCTFHAETTHRFGNDKLIPPTNFVQSNFLFQPEFVSNNQIEIEPRCEKDAMVISADGYLLPCDWIRNPQTFYKSQLWKQKDRWLNRLMLENNTYNQAIKVVRDWEKFVRQSSLDGSENVDVLCKMLCRKNCVSNNIVKIEL